MGEHEKQYFESVDKMSLSELNKEANRISLLVLNQHPVNYSSLLLKNEKIIYIKKRILDLKTNQNGDTK